MDVWRITVAALRRWYVLLPLLAVTGFAAIAAGNGVAPEYEARASVMIMPERAEGPVPNPYGDIDAANGAIGIVLNSVESRRAVQEQGLVSTYEVGAESRSTIFQLTVRADSREVAEQTGVAVIQLAKQELATRQTDAGLPEAAQYSLSVLEPPAVISVVQTGKTRVQAVVGVLGAGISLLVAVLFDDIAGLIRRFRAKRANRHDDVQAPDELNLPMVPTGEAAAEPPSGSPQPRGEPSGASAQLPSDDPGDDETTPSDDDLEPSRSSRQRRARYEVVRRS